MIQLISREDAFEKFPNISAEIARIQKDIYDSDELDFMEDSTWKTSYMNSYDALKRPDSNVTTYYKVIYINYRDQQSYPTALAKQLRVLMDSIGATPLLVLSHLKHDMVAVRELHRQPSDTALEKLCEVLPPTGFENAFEIGDDDFTILVERIFALLRSSCAAREYIFFCDRNDTLAFFICHYGNVHTMEFDQELLTPEVLANAKWIELKGRCYEKFL